jgi:transcriptional regulator with XRE-family HTH domain
MTFGESVRLQRISRGFSLREAAKLCGVSFSYLSDLERGRRQPPPAPVVRKLAAGLNTGPYIWEELAAQERWERTRK